MENLNITEKINCFEISVQVILMGYDLLVTISGGIEHIGAIGIAQPRKSIKDAKKVSSTSSVFTFLGHKEDIVVKEMSEGLSKRLNRKVIVVAGMHWDNLESKDIDEIMKLCKKIEDRIIEEILEYEKDYRSHNRCHRGDIRNKTS
ncbi:MAG: hypothetical protein N2596_04255 [Syntrophorhabdaceae bacterium]|nr:hypothetical protein [Syntrophorhabdaceae bacterium]